MKERLSSKCTPLTLEETLLRAYKILSGYNALISVKLKNIDISDFDQISNTGKIEILKRADAIFENRNCDDHMPPVVYYNRYSTFKVFYWGFESILAYKKAEIDEETDIFCIIHIAD